MDMSITSLIECGKDIRGNGSVFDLRQGLRPHLAENAAVSHAVDRLRKIKAAVCGSCQTLDSYRCATVGMPERKARSLPASLITGRGSARRSPT
jgi:hypothetical protein